MKIAILNGTLPHYDFGMNRVLSVITATLGELGMNVENISLGLAQIPYFDGHTASAADALTARLTECQGIILASGSQLFAPSAIMQNFLEYLEMPKYRESFAGKHCFALAVSKQGGERSALEYLTRVVQYSGGYDCVRLGLQESAAMNIANLPDVTEIIEKTTEDFYRAVRSRRRYIIPGDTAPPPVPVSAPVPAPAVPAVPVPVIPEAAPQHVGDAPLGVPGSTNNMNHGAAPNAVNHGAPRAAHPTNSAPPQKLNLDAFTERQEEDIRELTALFAQKYSQPKGSRNPYENLTTPIQTIIEPPIPDTASHGTPWAASPAVPAQPMPPAPQQIIAPLPSAVPLTVAAPLTAAVSQPRVKTVRQATASLPHYYQPQLAGHLTAVIQFSISGSDAFDGHLTISEGDCEYEEGAAANPDVTIIADTATWQKVLQGHNTAQKSFMIGGLKVRGNFMFLSKFDTLFKMPVL